MEEFKNLQETKLTSQPIFDGDVLHIYKDTVRLPNGKTSTREYTVHHGAVCILPLLENGDVPTAPSAWCGSSAMPWAKS